MVVSGTPGAVEQFAVLCYDPAIELVGLQPLPLPHAEITVDRRRCVSQWNTPCTCTGQHFSYLLWFSLASAPYATPTSNASASRSPPLINSSRSCETCKGGNKGMQESHLAVLLVLLSLIMKNISLLWKWMFHWRSPFLICVCRNWVTHVETPSIMNSAWSTLSHILSHFLSSNVTRRMSQQRFPV